MAEPLSYFWLVFSCNFKSGNSDWLAERIKRHILKHDLLEIASGNMDR